MNLAISIAGALQGILLSMFFFLRSRSRMATLMLGSYVFVFSVGLLENWFIENATSTFGQIVTGFISNSAYLYGPFLYLFIYYLTTGTSHLIKKHLIHFLPFLVFFLAQVVNILSGNELVEATGNFADFVLFELLVIQILTYNIAAIRRLDIYYRKMLETWSTIEEKDLRWLRRLLFVITLIYAFSFLLTHLRLLGVTNIERLYLIIQVSITLCIYLMSYKVLLKPILFTPELATPLSTKESEALPQILPSSEGEPAPESKYKKSGLKPEQAARHIEDLKRIMETEKPYKNPDLDVYALAQQLGISKNHFTQTLNEHLKVNFYEFINGFRIEEAKKLLLDPDYSNLSLDGIANESGYKSRTTFFNNFKKMTGQTPTEWSKSKMDHQNP